MNKKRGRPMGQKQLVGVKMSELNKVLKDDCVIPISVKFFKTLSGENKIQEVSVPKQDLNCVFQVKKPKEAVNI